MDSAAGGIGTAVPEITKTYRNQLFRADSQSQRNGKGGCSRITRSCCLYGGFGKFHQKNINCSIEESLQRFVPVIELAKQHDIKVRGYVSCVLGCPYEGEISADKVAEVTEKLFQLGCYEVSLGDTIGTGTPRKAHEMFKSCQQIADTQYLALHFHNTYGQALANIYACMELGSEIIDSSVAGLGGCPYAKGASGNVATEDVIYMLNGMNIECGINLEKLVETGNWISEKLNRLNNSQVGKALNNSQ